MRDLLARELFETTYGIYDHGELDSTNPFPLVTYHKTRPKNWVLRDHIKNLLEEDVPRRTGMSLNDLLYNTSTDYYNAIIETVDKINKEEGKLSDDLINGTQGSLEDVINAIEKKNKK